MHRDCHVTKTPYRERGFMCHRPCPNLGLFWLTVCGFGQTRSRMQVAVIQNTLHCVVIPITSREFSKPYLGSVTNWECEAGSGRGSGFIIFSAHRNLENG